MQYGVVKKKNQGRSVHPFLLSMHQCYQPGQRGLWSKQGVMCGGRGRERGRKADELGSQLFPPLWFWLKIAIHPFKVNSYVWRQNAQSDWGEQSCQEGSPLLAP